MKIQIVAHNAPAIRDALEAARGRAKAHTIGSFEELSDLISFRVSRACELNRSAHIVEDGDTFELVSGDKLPSSYKSMPKRTIVTIKREGNTFYLIGVEVKARGSRLLPEIITQRDTVDA